MKTTLVALNAHYMHTNLALRQLMPTLGAFDARFYEGHINLVYRKLLSDIALGEPDVIGFSCYIWNIPLVFRLCRALRLVLPGVKLILGGPEVAYRAEDALANHPEIDFVLCGEGESALAPLLEAIRAGACLEAVPGLCYRSGEKIMRNPTPAPLPPERWPDPYADGIAGLERRILYAETSRGCPYNCQYCLSSAEQGVRALPPGEAIRRLTRLAGEGAQLIKLVDRTFNFDPIRAREIWAGLIGHARMTGYSGTYHFEIGAHLIDGTALDVLKRAPAGLFQFEVGVQSSDPGVLNRVGRAARFEAVADGTRAVRALGNIHLYVDLIAGMPGDDMHRFARSFDDAWALGAEQLQLGFLKLLHGSGLRRDAAALGIRFEPDAPYEVISTRELGFQQLNHLKDVERALNWYAGGRYRLTLKWLLLRKKPFELFSGLADQFRRGGVFDIERGEKARAEALILACDSPELRALMRHDLLISGRRRELPDALAFQEDAAQRGALRERFHPVRGQSVFRYAFDVPEFEKSGRLIERAVTLVYNPPECFEIEA